LQGNLWVCGAGSAFRAWGRIGCAAGRGAQPLVPHGFSNRDDRRPHPARRPARMNAQHQSLTTDEGPGLQMTVALRGPVEEIERLAS